MDRECTECTERICCNLQLCELNADWLCSFGQEQSKISLDRAQQAEEEQAQNMQNVI